MTTRTSMELALTEAPPAPLEADDLEMDVVPFDIRALLTDSITSGRVRIPPAPTVALRLHQMITRDDFSIQDLARVVCLDQSIAAAVLRAANIAAYGSSGRVTTLVPAIQRLGASGLVSVCLGATVGISVALDGPLQQLRRRVWLESIMSAQVCYALAGARKLARETGFLCGLLHDFGKIATLACIEDIVALEPDVGAMTTDFWLDVVDAYHAAVGAIVARGWDLPPELNEVIEHHHDCEKSAQKEIIEVVTISDEVVRQALINPTLPDEALLEIAGVRDQVDADAIKGALATIPRLLDSMGPAPISSTKAKAPALVKPERPLREMGVTVGITVTIIGGASKSTYRGVFMTKQGLVIEGPGLLQEGHVVQAELRTPAGNRKIWLHAVTCRRNRGGYLIETRPFALSGEDKMFWYDVLNNAVTNRASPTPTERG